MPTWAERAGIAPPKSPSPVATSGSWASRAGINLNALRGTPEKDGFIDDAIGVGRQFLGGVNDVTRLPFSGLPPNLRALAGDVFSVSGAPNREPEGLAENAARFAGQTVLPSAGAGKLAALVTSPIARTGASKLGKAKDFIQRGVAQAGRDFTKSPGKFISAETGLGAAAGAGGYVGERIGDGSSGAKFTGELVGGILPAFLPVNLAVKAGAAVKNWFASGGKATDRVINRLQRATTVDEATDAIAEIEGLTTMDPNTGQPVLSVAQRTGNQGTLSLERSVADASEEAVGQFQDHAARSNEVLQDEFLGIGGGKIGDVDQQILGAQSQLAKRVDAGIKDARRETAQKIAGIEPSLDRELSNVVARGEQKEALNAARAKEKILFDNVPEETPIGFHNAKKAYDDLRGGLSSAELSDLPRISSRYLNEKGNLYFGLDDATETTIKEIRGLQSKLRAVARNAASGENKNLNMARLANGVADGIKADIELAATGSEAVSQAVDFSRKLNERFGSKTMAKVLKRTVSGADSVDKSLVLDETIGLAGPKARQQYDEMLKVFDSPDAPDSKVFIEASEEYIRGRFITEAVDSGNLNISSAKAFVKRHKQLLKRMPGVEDAFESSIKSGNTLALRESQKSRLFLGDPRVSKAAMFIEKGPVETFKKISKMRPSSMVNETKKLINLVNRDKTGDALKGLKTAYLEYILDQARGHAVDKSGRKFLSGYAIRDALEQTRGIAKTLLKGEEKRLRIIARDLIKLEKSLKSKPSKEGLIGDVPGRIMDTLAGFLGVNIASQTRKITGGAGSIQIPGMMANAFRKMGRDRITDPASKLIRDALQDEKLFKQLLQSTVSKSGKMDKFAIKRLHIWAANAIAENGGAYDQDEE